jgi:tetraacyldisaccharide 4'-kinase
MARTSWIEKHWLQRSLVSYLLFPFSILFSIIVSLRRCLYRNFLPRYRSPVFIISIGNIIAGGSGKTPFTIYLADYLKQKGLKVAVSHRGYKGELENSNNLISTREELLPLADKAGDEAWLIAKKLSGIPVAAGRDRIKVIKLLCKTYPDLDCIILDDSFQHLKLKHDLDIVIVNDMLRFGNGFVLPAGYLREPVSALAYADFLILNRFKSNDELKCRFIRQLNDTGKPVIEGAYCLDKIFDFLGQEISLGSVVGEKAILNTGIGNPSGFDAMLKEIGIDVIGANLFPDHYSYQDKSCRDRIVHDFRKSGAKWLAITEKDYAKLRFYPEFQDFTLVFSISFKTDSKDDCLLDSLTMKLITNPSKD